MSCLPSAYSWYYMYSVDVQYHEWPSTLSMQNFKWKMAVLNDSDEFVLKIVKFIFKVYRCCCIGVKLGKGTKGTKADCFIPCTSWAKNSFMGIRFSANPPSFLANFAGSYAHWSDFLCICSYFAVTTNWISNDIWAPLVTFLITRG